MLVFPPQDEVDNYVVLPYFWIPEENVSLRVRRDHVPYDVWQKQGFLHTTEGNVVHYGYIEKFIETMGEQYNIREIAFDPRGGGAGARYRWCRISRVWDLPSSRSGRDSRI